MFRTEVALTLDRLPSESSALGSNDFCKSGTQANRVTHSGAFKTKDELATAKDEGCWLSQPCRYGCWPERPIV